MQLSVSVLLKLFLFPKRRAVKNIIQRKNIMDKVNEVFTAFYLYLTG